MKKALLTLLTLTSMAFAFDMGGMASSVDTTKAMDSVDKDKAKAAASKGKDIEMKDVSDSVDTKKAKDSVDTKKLMKALMLSSDELLMLLKLFMKKMDKIFPELQKAIQDKNYKQIAMISHSIKGSSGNFRMKEVQELSSEMEDMARTESKSYDYCNTYEEIEKIINSINIE